MTIKIPVYWKQEIVGHTLVSDCDFYLQCFKWRYNEWGYVYRNSNLIGPDGARKCRRVYIHRMILDLDFGEEWHGHHRNGDPNDNRRENLLITTPLENYMMNNGANESVILTPQ